MPLPHSMLPFRGGTTRMTFAQRCSAWLITILSTAFAGILAVVALPWILPLYLHDRRIKRELAKAGRFLKNREFAARLTAGDGTLIAVQDYMGRTIHWWTEEDVIGNAPVTLPPRNAIDSARSEALRLYAERCLARYIDYESGIALLTNGTMKLVDEPLHVAFPAAKAVTIVTWTDEPTIVEGLVSDY